ncbi:FAD binding domain-containing protein [Bacillaceae bacterium Marseille-Q3522]|nr:FAD binding domain-containing protein [Bacillaceae bacterium Marseille-Q3522]
MDKVGALRDTVVWQPQDVAEAWEIKLHYGEKAAYIAGGTVIQMQREQGIALPEHLISLEKIAAMHGISGNGDGSVTIGALTHLADCSTHTLLKENAEMLTVAAAQIASPAVRNQATIGGNIAYRTGDAIPALLTIDAEVTIFSEKGIVATKLNDYIPHKDGLIISLTVPKEATTGNQLKVFRKIGRREAFIPSLVTIAVSCRSLDGKVAEDVRIAAGGGTTLPIRLRECEQLLRERKPAEQCLEELHEKIIKEFQPAGDMFASADYRSRVAANLIVAELEDFFITKSTG